MQEHFVEKKSPFCSKFSTPVEFFSTKGNIPLEYTSKGQDLLTDSMWLLVWSYMYCTMQQDFVENGRPWTGSGELQKGANRRVKFHSGVQLPACHSALCSPLLALAPSSQTLSHNPLASSSRVSRCLLPLPCVRAGDSAFQAWCT